LIPGAVRKYSAVTYDLFARPIDRMGFASLRQRATSDLSGRVLELGAGTGLNFSHYRAASAVVAVEPDPAMRERGARRARQAVVPIEVADARAERLPFPDQSFDAAVITLVLCSVDDVERSLAELRRVLRPGAPVRLIEHVRSPQPSVAAIQGALTPLQRRLAGNCHLDRCTGDALRAAGFTVERCRSHLGGSLLELAARGPSVS